MEGLIWFIGKVLPWILLFGWLLYVLLVFAKLIRKPNFYIFENIPNVFISLGLLGTFLGITYGLFHFDTDPDKIKSSIQELLAGLRLAFLTSIVGILLSIIFRKVVDSLITTNYVTEPSTPEEGLLKSILHEIQTSNNIQSRLVTNQITGNKLQQDVLHSLNHFSEKLADSNATAITGALEDVISDFNDTFRTLIGQLVDKNFEKLTESIDQLIVWQKVYKNDIIDLKKAYESLAQNHKNFVSNTENWVSNLDNIAGKSSELKKLVEDFQAAFNDESRFKDLISKIFNATENLEKSSIQFQTYATKIEETEVAFSDISTNVEEWLNKEEGVKEMVHSLSHSLSELRRFDISEIENLETRFNERLSNTFRGLDDLLKSQLLFLEEKRNN